LIYLDTSVALAHLLAEQKTPPDALWEEHLVSSRLLQYEIWTRIHSLGVADALDGPIRALLAKVSLIELSPPVLERALDPFPTSLRTLDALHLASVDFLQRRGLSVALATYDGRLLEAARRLEIEIYSL
jgi:predicted nucleic acid-binding protein